jgi:hypothetical protein
MFFQQPSVHVLGVQVDEPVTSFTALLISGVCLYSFIKLNKISIRSKAHFYLQYYFLILSGATAIGGIIGHAFLFHFSFAWKLVGWILSMISIMLIERASIEYASRIINLSFAKWLRWINLIELTLFITITVVSLKFFFVEVHTTYGLLIVVASLHYYVYRKTKSKGSFLFLIAVGFAALSALIYMNRWGLSRWFTHSDISHIFLMVSAWFFYRGSKKIIQEDNQP